MARKVNSSMRFTEMVVELAKHIAEAPEDDIAQLKKQLAAKIASLPADENTIRIVNKVEDLLQDVGAGGRVSSLLQTIQNIDDEDVQKQTNKVAKIIAAIDFDRDELQKLFRVWNKDKIIKVDKLLSGGTMSMAELINGYGKSPNITELVDDLSVVTDYGIGPGEFMLAVLSKRITGIGAGGGKGDLIIDNKPVELKTKSKKPARFVDREVRPTSEYAGAVQSFKQKYEQQFQELEGQGKVVRAKSGISETHLALFLEAYPDAVGDVARVIEKLFAGLPKAGSQIASLLAKGQLKQAKQMIARANVQNYLNVKRQNGDLAGILFMDIPGKEFNYIKDVKDLDGTGLRLNMGNAYLIQGQDNPYPQIAIVKQ